MNIYTSKTEFLEAENKRLHALNNELLDSFDEILAVKFSNWSDGEMREIARTAIARAKDTCKAEGKHT